jgi:Protein NO VEIN, C-terminal
VVNVTTALAVVMAGDAEIDGVATTAWTQCQAPEARWRDLIMKPDITEDEIRAVFTAPDGALASKLHESISEGLEKNDATQIDPLVNDLVEEDHPLRSGGFKNWDEIILAKARKEWKELKDAEKRWKEAKTTKTSHFPATRYAVRWWLELIFPELRPLSGLVLPGDAADDTSNKTDGPGHGGRGPGHDLITGRRTKKKEYGENLAVKWGWTVPGAVSVKKVADDFDKLGYDVRVTLADGNQLHIEAKTTEGTGSMLAITEGERKHNQDSGCKHEHVLFVVSDVKAAISNDEWHCSGGTPAILPNWKIATSDLTEQPSWLYKVPQTTPVHIADMPEQVVNADHPAQ